MTLQLMVILTGVIQAIHALMQYKFAEDFTDFYLVKRLLIPALLAGLALLEYSVFDTYYLTYVLVVSLSVMLFGFVVFVGTYPYVFFMSKIAPDKAISIKLFLRHFKVRSFRGDSKSANFYFLQTNGLTIFFSESLKSFNALSEHSLGHFKNSIAYNQPEGLALGSFVVIQSGEDYLSLSSDDIAMLDVPFYKVTPDHFKSLQMFKI